MAVGDAVSIRLADINDLEALTELHCASFKPEEHVPVALGRNYVKATYRWMVTSKDAYTLIAELDGKIAGLVAMCDKAYTRPMFIACLPEFFASLLRNPRLLFNRRLWKRLFRRPEGDSQTAKRITEHPQVAQLTFVAVKVDVRGQGVFPRLLDGVKQYTRDRHLRAIRVGVYNWNMASQRAFIKTGWVPAPELTTPDTVFFMAFLDDSIARELGLEHRLNGESE